MTFEGEKRVCLTSTSKTIARILVNWAIQPSLNKKQPNLSQLVLNQRSPMSLDPVPDLFDLNCE